MTNEQQKFIEMIAEKAMHDFKTYRILPSLTIAQSILESGWGKSELAMKANNLFGIKSNGWNGEIYTVKTVEHEPDGTPYIITADFRKYDNVDDSINDHSIFLLKERYRPVLKCTNYIDACVAIRECGYATDINYTQKLINIIETYNLNKYDEIAKEDDKMKLIKNFSTKNKCYIIYQKHTPVGLFLHSVGCPQPSSAVFIKNWNTYQPGCNNSKFNYQGSKTNCANCAIEKKNCRSVCVHGFIDDVSATQTLPFDCVGWHSGGGKNGNANFMGYIGFEMCEPNTIKYTGGATFVDNDPAATLEFVKNTYANAVDIYAQICIELGFNPIGKTKDGYPVILSHAEGHKLGIASNHGDPEHLWKYTIKKTMDDFRNDVLAKMNEYGGKIDEPNVDKKPETNIETKPENNVLYRVQCGAFSVKTNADNLLSKLKNAGYNDAFIKNDGKYYRVQVGAFSVKINAEKLLNELKTKGFNTYLISTTTTTTPEPEPLKIGDVVKMANDAPVFGSNRKFQSWVYNSKLYVREIDGNRIVVSTLKTGAITGPVDVKYLTKL